MTRSIFPILAALALGAGVAVAARRRSRSSAQRATPAPSRSAPSMPPDVSRLVDPKVFADFPAWVSSRGEGNVSTMYRDVKGLVTTGRGNLIDLRDAITPTALALPWLHEDGRRATEDEIRAEWARVKAMPPALFYTKYAEPAKGRGLLHLSDDAIASLVRSHLAGDIKFIVGKLPDFPTYPAPAQQALLGMSWGLGAYGLTSGYPALIAACRARDWRAAAAASVIPEARPATNAAHRDLFLAAAAAVA